MGSADGVWLDLTAELLGRPLVVLPVAALATQLLATFDGVGCTFSTEDLDGRLTGTIHPLDEQFGGHRPAMEDGATGDLPHLHPILRQYRAVGYADVVQVADVPERFADRRVHAAWRELAEPWNAAEQLALPLPCVPRSAFVVGRTTPFTAAELALAHRVRRLLDGLHRQATALAGVQVTPPVAADLHLTPRQGAVLGLLAEGRTAAAIGRRLGITERTVHKHLQHVYDRLGVTDRLAAVLRARDAGLLPAR